MALPNSKNYSEVNLMSKNLQPEIRFKGFSDDWNFNNLDDLVLYKNGISLETYIDKNAKYYLVTLNSMDINGDLKAKHLKVRYISNYVLEKNDIVMILSDVAHGDFLGLSALIPSDNKYVLNQRIASLKIKEKHKINPHFLRFFINANQRYFKKLGQGSSQLNLSKKSVLDLTTYFPEKIEEQKQIGDFFQSIDKDIYLQKEKLNKTKNLKKAMLEKMFPKEGSKQPEVRFDGFSGDWEEKKISDVLRIRSGMSQKNVEISDGVYPILATGGIIGRTNTALYSKESVLIGRKGTIDKPYYMNTPFWTVDTLFYSELFDNVDGFFIYTLFQKIEWRNYNTSTGVPSLTGSAIHAIDIIVPFNKEEQLYISKYFKKLDDAIALQSEQLEKLKNIKKAYLAKMFV